MPEPETTETAEAPTPSVAPAESVSADDEPTDSPFGGSDDLFARAFGPARATSEKAGDEPDAEAAEAAPDGGPVRTESGTSKPEGQQAVKDEQSAAPAESEAESEHPAGDKPKGRRAEAEEERKREVQAAVDAALAAREQAAVATAERDRVLADQQALTHEALARIGTDQEYEALRAEAYACGIEGRAMDYERASRLQQLTENRRFSGVYDQLSQQRSAQHYAEETGHAAKKLGIDLGALESAVRAQGNQARTVPEFFYRAGASSRDAEVESLNERISRLEAENTTLTSRTAATAKAVAPNGRAAAESDDTGPSFELGVDRLFDVAFGSSNGARR